MCELVVVGRVCWPVVVGLALCPLGAALVVVAGRELEKYEALLRRGMPFERLRPGPALVSGVLRAQSGSAYLEEPGTGRRVRLEGGLWPLPPPGTAVSVQGEALGSAPDSREAGYREMHQLWRLRPDEILRGRRAATPAPAPLDAAPRALDPASWGGGADVSLRPGAGADVAVVPELVRLSLALRLGIETDRQPPTSFV